MTTEAAIRLIAAQCEQQIEAAHSLSPQQHINSYNEILSIIRRLRYTHKRRLQLEGKLYGGRVQDPYSP